MGNKFAEVVFEEHFDTVKGYVEGFQDGMGTSYQVFYSSEAGIKAETFSEIIKEWISLGHKLNHVVMEEALVAKIQEQLSKKGENALITSDSIKSAKSVKEATFNFKFEAYARKYADEIKDLLSNIPEGVSLHDYKPEEIIDPKAKGVELYAPAHDYIFHGKGTIIGPFEQVVTFRNILNDHPLIDADKVLLDLC